MENLKPRIALFPSYDDGAERMSLLLRYVRAIEMAGGVPFVLPLTDSEDSYASLAQICDGALFPGGDDVYPHIYGETVHEGFGSACRGRDKGEFCFFKKIIELKKPFLGICRGIQLVNVGMGGTLYQDIPLEYGREILHRQQPPYSVPHHSVTLKKGSKVAELAGAEKLMVNSMHHQSIKTAGNDVKIVGYADDGIVEAIELENYPFGIAVQWHPEHLVDNDLCSRRLFEGLICAGKK